METNEIINDLNATLQAVLDGETDPIRAYRDMKVIADTISADMDAMYSSVIDELDKYNPKELAERGIQVRAGTRKWDYSSCGEWVYLKEQMKALEEQLKTRCSLTQKELMDAETGEILDRPTYTVGKRAICFLKLKKS